jgi:hypothetical protein
VGSHLGDMRREVDEQVLIAVDLGLRTGVAVYGRDGRLQRYRSQHFGDRNALRRGALGALDLVRGGAAVRWLVLEGDVQMAAIWARAGERRGASSVVVQAERWRSVLLHPVERRDARRAKTAADGLARAVIAWSGAPAPTSLRHDAAEAVLAGLWGVLEVGWLPALPPALDPRRRSGG